MEKSSRTSAPMTPDRWRVVDAILRGALDCEAGRRAGFVRDACAGDETLRRDVESLLAAHDGMAEDFLEQPVAAGAFGTMTPVPNEPIPIALAAALADHYAIETVIASGGMATVYLARDLRHDRRVAIKVMRDEVGAAVGVERFLEEIRVTASLQHPHILPLFDSGSVGRLLWYAMPFVDGDTLRARLARDGRLSIAEAVRVAREVADALEHAHARGIVHRDIKPENILLQQGHALVADFGIALALEHAGEERLTRTGLTLGTPQYMAPEQAAGERALDVRVDIYALGVVVYEMLAGEPPFAAASRQAVVQRMLLEPPPPLSALRPDVSPTFEAAVSRALAKRPELRFTSMATFAAALLASPNGTESSSPSLGKGLHDGRDAVPSANAARRMGRARVATYAAIAGIGAGLVGGWGLAHSSIGGRWQRDSSQGWQPEVPAATIAVPTVRANMGASTDGLSLVIVDRDGRVQRRIPANRPWTPRFSPDGRQVAYGAFGWGRSTSDIWVTDVGVGTTKRLTDDDSDSNDPQWSPDGTVIAYSVNAPGGKDIATRRLADGMSSVVAARPGTQFASDWLPDGSALLVTDDARAGGHDILVQPMNGSPAHTLAQTGWDELAARLSPDGKWIAYSSDASGRREVYVDSYPAPRRHVMISQGGGADPVWRGDGRELYYWRSDSLVAVELDPARGDDTSMAGTQRVLFRAAYQQALNTMYDVSRDGRQFVLVKR